MEPFKNWLNKSAAEQIAQQFAKHYPSFASKVFLKNIEESLEPLNLKSRVMHLKDRLYPLLPEDPRVLFPLLMKTLKKKSSNPKGLEGFRVWPLTEIVAERGLDHLELSLETLKEMTKVFTGEFAIRPFLLQRETATLRILSQWVKDPDSDVRRLVSEGSRPLLPWGQKIPRFAEDPTLTWTLLERLKLDPSPYVRKSVANHINDHSKNHPDFVLNRLEQWQQDSPNDPELNQLIRHATRTMVKKGLPKALGLHGIKPSNIQIISTKVITPKIKIGEFLEVKIVLLNRETKDVNCLVDHEIHLLRQNGTYNVKIFKGSKINLGPGEKKELCLRISFREVTVRRYYEGIQFWSAKVNGISQSKRKFVLSTPFALT